MMTKPIVWVCANDEELFQGTYLAQHGNERDDTIAVCRAAHSIIEADGRCESKDGAAFRDWNGGRFDQFYERSGRVAFNRDAPQWLRDLASAADAAMVAEITRRDTAAEQADREFFADHLASGDELTTGMAFEIEQYLLCGICPSDYTTESLIAALRANDAALLVSA